jgi:hypothetical protein
MKNKQFNTSFPIWEKVYLEITPDKLFDNIHSVQVKNIVYIFPSTYDEKNKNFYVLDLDAENIREEEMEYQGCFHPVYDTNNIIYLFRFDSGKYSDFRYSIVEYNIETKKWGHNTHKGVAPKRRSDDFSTIFYNSKIYFIGGMQKFPGDNTGNLMYTYNTIDNEWAIESYNGSHLTELPGVPYLANRSGMNGILNLGVISSNLGTLGTIGTSTEPVPKWLLIGGKYLENSFSNNINGMTNSLSSSLKNFFNDVETDDIFEYDFSSQKLNKKQYIKILNDVKFSNCSSCLYKECIIIHNKGNFYNLDLTTHELSMLKPLLFNPNASKDSILLIHNNFLFIISKFQHYEDCIIFKTSVDNLIPKWNSMKEISYEMLLNNKECSDIVFLLNAGDKNREILVNKKVMYNFSSPLKNIIINCAQNSNYYNFNDVSFFGVYNTLKFIYSNFNDNISSYEIEIIQEMIDIIVRYRAKSLLNITLSHIKLTNENALVFYELALKFNLNEFKKFTFNFISENLQNASGTNAGLFSKDKNVNEGPELKKILFENYFCIHPITIQVNTIGFDIKNLSQITVTSERFADIKELCKDNKIYFCLNCKKVIVNEKTES